MWHSHFCFFIFLIFVSVIVRCGVCEKNVECDQEYPVGSNRTILMPPEIFLKGLMIPKDMIENIIGGIRDILGPKKEVFKKPTFGNILNRFASKFHAIFPGTLWCGDGNIAKEEKDLGLFKQTDACCRAHDQCKNNIEVRHMKLNLKNNGIFTRSACLCDHEFYNCLEKVGSIVSKKIQCTYFNVLRPQCFTCTCPKDCPENDDTGCNGHCTRYTWEDNSKASFGPFCLFP